MRSRDASIQLARAKHAPGVMLTASMPQAASVRMDGWMELKQCSAAGMPCCPHNCEHASSMPGVQDGQEQATPKRSKNGSTRGI